MIMTTVTRSTRLIHSESSTYPVYLANMATYAPNTCFGAAVDSDLLLDFGVEVVHDTEQPTGDIVSEGMPELRDGEWYQTWTVRNFSEEEQAGKLLAKKNILSEQAEVLRANAFAQGFPYTFPGGQVYHVQVRTADRGNISDLRTIAKEILKEERPPMTFPFRVWENVSVALSAQEFVDMADTALVKVMTGYQVSWDYKGAIDAAVTEADLPVPPTDYFPG
jgi:hypothetical protein